MKTAFLIAAPTSGSGKTTVARGLMALAAAKGMKVQPFKCGPDYIDTKFHEAATGRASINLDTFMATPEHVRELFLRYGSDADICVVEGMMGMFDGYDREGRRPILRQPCSRALSASERMCESLASYSIRWDRTGMLRCCGRCATTWVSPASAVCQSRRRSNRVHVIWASTIRKCQKQVS